MEQIAIYSRVSTEDQHPENQLLRLRESTKVRNWLIYKEYTDKISGAKDKRPELDKMLQDARAGKFSKIFITKVDRLGRSVLHIEQLFSELERLNIDVVALDQPIDTSGPYSKVMRQILSAFAELEREFIVDRTKEGINRARKQGKRIGRPPISDYKKRKIIKIATKHPSFSLKKIANELGIPKSTIAKVLKESPSINTPPSKSSKSKLKKECKIDRL